MICPRCNHSNPAIFDLCDAQGCPMKHYKTWATPADVEALGGPPASTLAQSVAAAGLEASKRDTTPVRPYPMVAEAPPSPAIEDSFAFEARMLATIQTPDTPEHFREISKAIWMRQSDEGAKHRTRFKLRVVFYVANSSRAAHVEILLAYLKGLTAIEDPPLKWWIVCHGEPKEEFTQAFEGRVFYATAKTMGFEQAWKATQKYCNGLHIEAFVHVSYIGGVAFAAGMRCALKHIQWAQKWHDRVPGVDGFISTTGGDVPEPWIKCRAALPDLEGSDEDRGARMAAAQVARGTLGVAPPMTIFGTLGRTEKLTNEFAEAVHAILNRKGDAIFVYSGRSEFKPLQGHTRIKYLGWVDTALWVHALDVYLDTWPFHSGLTAWQAIAARKPLVSIEQKDTSEQRFVMAMMKQADHPHLVALTVDQYISQALEAAEGKVAPFIESNLAFYREHMRDEARLAREVSEAICKITLG